MGHSGMHGMQAFLLAAFFFQVGVCRACFNRDLSPANLPDSSPRASHCTHKPLLLWLSLELRHASGMRTGAREARFP